MEDQTRQLISLLADGLTNELLELLAEGEWDEAALRSEVHGSRQSINRRLEDLRGWGVVGYTEPSRKGPGRPGRTWSLNDQRVTRFANEADAIALELLEGKVARQQAGIKRRRRRSVHNVADAS